MPDNCRPCELSAVQDAALAGLHAILITLAACSGGPTGRMAAERART